MKQFLKKLFGFLSIALLPLLILLAGYIYYDPFKILRAYKDYSYPYVIPNRDYVSTEVFLKNEKKQDYNSFIFGSSRTIAFPPATWKKYLHDTDRVYLFDASGEAIYGIYTKLKFLDEQNVKIDNALLLFCRDAIFRYTENFDEHLTIKHPAVSGESWLLFHYVFFKAYLNSKFLASFYNYTFTKKFKPYMTGFIEERKIFCDTVSNGLRILNQEKEIAQDPAGYYQRRNNLFYTRKGEAADSVNRINEKSLFMLNEIKRILLKHRTNYKIVLSPIYDEVKFHPEDLIILRNIFGNNLYDFTGDNNVTRSKYNWYEDKHFRPFIGDSLLNLMYK
jgi:hypothetical protein